MATRVQVGSLLQTLQTNYVQLSKQVAKICLPGILLFPAICCQETDPHRLGLYRPICEIQDQQTTYKIQCFSVDDTKNHNNAVVWVIFDSFEETSFGQDMVSLPTWNYLPRSKFAFSCACSNKPNTMHLKLCHASNRSSSTPDKLAMLKFLKRQVGFCDRCSCLIFAPLLEVLFILWLTAHFGLK